VEEKAKADRPLGIAILAVLDIICGIAALIGGIVLAAVSTIVDEPEIEDAIRDAMTSAGVTNVEAVLDILATVLIVLGVFICIMGLVAIVVGWGFWTGKQWAWILGVILFIISIAASAVGMVWAPTNVIGVIIDALILYYLFRPNVKAWFGRT
jgi:hypothetical protein